jgi:membrane-associated protease RseP (regulator of RpoE activity)
MVNALGIVLFAFGIFLSICLHEAGHMGTAKAFGMKVTRYFAGFGPTLFSFRRGETEYGLKAIPAGGFVKIVGMTPLDDDVEPEDEPRSFWRKPLWQRTIVLSAGSITHFVIGLILLFVCAAWVGVPNPALANYDVDKGPTVIGAVSECVPLTYHADLTPEQACKGQPPSPAKKAQLAKGDKLIALDGKPVSNYAELVKAIKGAKDADVTVDYLRAGVTHHAKVTLVRGEQATSAGKDPKVEIAWRLGISPQLPDPFVTYGAAHAVGPTIQNTGLFFANTFQAIGQFPQKVPKLIDALSGKQRDADTPISVVGASRLGGEAAQAGLWQFFVLMLATLNIFIGVFNLFPLLPLDGGHIAIAWYERLRSALAARRGRPDPGRVDYAKLMPLTYAVILVFGGITILTLATDIVNPISLFGR